MHSMTGFGRGAVLEGVGAEPGFVPPRATVAEGSVTVGPYGIALLWSTGPLGFAHEN